MTVYYGFLPCLQNNSNQLMETANVSNLVPLFINTLFISTAYYEGGPGYPNTGLIISTGANANTQNANNAYTDGNLWAWAANTFSINRTDAQTGTSRDFRYDIHYLYNLLSEPTATVTPNVDPRTVYPSIP